MVMSLLSLVGWSVGAWRAGVSGVELTTGVGSPFWLAFVRRCALACDGIRSNAAAIVQSSVVRSWKVIGLGLSG